MSEEKVLLVTLLEKNGEREYYHHCYYEKYNPENMPPEKTILEGFFGELGEEAEAIRADKGWWLKDYYNVEEFISVEVACTRMISKEDAEVLKRYYII